jgi:predicted transcriptional regulator
MKHPTSYRLSAEALRLIDQLATKLGLGKTAVLELAIRKLAEREGLPDPR